MLIPLLLLWIVFTGNTAWPGLLLGLLVSGSVTAFCRAFLGYRPRPPLAWARHCLLAAGYALFLFREIAVSAAQMLPYVYRREPPAPVIVKFHSKLRTQGAQVLAANSITLTPGTYTAALSQEGEFAVHALDAAFAQGLETCGFFDRAQKLEE